MPAAALDTRPAACGQRRVCFGGGSFVDTPVFRRSALVAGHRIDGPAVIEQLDSTTLVLPGQRTDVDRYGNLVVRIGEAGR